MAITININSIDRSNIIQHGSVVKKDAINQLTDTLEFRIRYYPGQTFRPDANLDVTMYDGATKVFGGKIISVTAEIEAQGTVEYVVRCKDYSYDLERLLVNEEYNNQTVNAIITALRTNWTDGTFTQTNTNCTLVITKVSFDRITVVEAIQRLADMTGFSWYVDYNKDIHFFATNTEVAPFSITDSNGKAMQDSIRISTDLSQIRNRVFVKGGEVEGTSRTEVFSGDATKKFFKLANKFSQKPTVTISAVNKTVGVDYIDEEASFDCFWDFNQQYIRFKDSTIPAAGTNNISVAGIPLYNLVVQVEEPLSIAAYGIFEFAKIDKNIKAREEAVSLAKTELQAYRDGVLEASFDSYESGLRSGQIINITSTLLNVNEDYLIQSVQFRMIGETKGLYKVELATLRTTGIIDFLISLLRQPGRVIEDKGEVVLEKTVFPQEIIGVQDVIAINTDDIPKAETMGVGDNRYPQALDFPVIFVAGPYVHDPTNATDYKRLFVLDSKSMLG